MHVHEVKLCMHVHVIFISFHKIDYNLFLLIYLVML
jgi:hypothetical protein